MKPIKTTPRTLPLLSPIKRLTKLADGNLMAMMVILTACDKYTDACLADPDATRKAMENSPFNGDAWLDACEQVRKARA
jgi:hypothetical protein